MARTAKKPVSCEICGKVFTGDNPRKALGGHLSKHRTDPTPGTAFEVDLRTASVVQQIFPNGIPTQDNAQLVEDLRLILSLRRRVATL